MPARLRHSILCLLCIVFPAAELAAEELTIAVATDAPPYIMKQGTTGIDIDILHAALKPSGNTFKVKQMPYGDLAESLAEDGVDAAANVLKLDDGAFYSDNFIKYRNFAITKEAAGIKLESIADLKGKTIAAWDSAYEDLGPEYEKLFSPNVDKPYRKKYHEFKEQAEQVEAFWSGKVEVIVIDEAIFRWLTRQLADKVDTSAELSWHKIFPGTSQYRVKFKSKTVRDDFNAGLKQLIESGQYQKIYDKYLK